MSRRHFDHHGAEITRAEWVEKFRHDDYRVLARTTVQRTWLIQTLWMGVNVSDRGRPCYFETVAQRKDNPERVTSLAKWPTHELAVIGHRKVISDIRRGRITI